MLKKRGKEEKKVENNDQIKISRICITKRFNKTAHRFTA